MAVQLGDLLVIERAGTSYRTTAQDLLDFLSDNIGTTNHKVVDIVARDALVNLSVGDRVQVDDASADISVNAGWAIYAKTAGGFQKVAEEESLDIIIGNSDLGIVRTATTATVTNSNGTDATIPGANSTEAGLMTASDFTKLGFVSVTGAIDLDAILLASHVAATTAGTALTNPISIAGQVIGFSISGLTAAP